MKKIIMIIGIFIMTIQVTNATLCDSDLNPSFSLNFTDNVTSHLITNLNYIGNGTYEGNHIISNQSFSYIFYFPCSDLFNYSLTTENLTLNTNDFGYVFFDIHNYGSDTLELNFTTDSEILQPTKTTFTYPNSLNLLPLFYNTSGKLGEYLITLNDSYNSYPITVTINDNNPPNFKKIDYTEEVGAGKDIQIKVEVEDDFNVSQVIIFIEDGQTFNLTQSDDLWEGTFKSTGVGTKTLTITATDNSNNTATRTMRIKTALLGGIEYYYYSPIELATGYTYKEKIFSSDSTIPINITITDFYVYPNNTQYEMTISGTSIDEFVMKPNRTSHFDNFQGDLYLSMTFYDQCRYSGLIEIEVPDWVGESNKTDFVSRVGNLTILPRQTISFGLRTLTCEFQNTGSYQTSNYICSFPVDIRTELKNLGVFLTEHEYEVIKQGAKSDADKYKSFWEGEQIKTLILLVFIIFIIVVLILVYIVKFSGRRIRVGIFGS